MNREVEADRLAEKAFRERTEGLVKLVGENRGSAELATLVRDFLIDPERGFKLVDFVKAVPKGRGKRSRKKFELKRVEDISTGIEVVAKPGNKGVIITVYGEKRRLDIDPDDWLKVIHSKKAE